MKIRLDCELCKIYVDLPLEQFRKKEDGGLFLNNLNCINCQSKLTLDLVFDK